MRASERSRARQKVVRSNSCTASLSRYPSEIQYHCHNRVSGSRWRPCRPCSASQPPGARFEVLLQYHLTTRTRMPMPPCDDEEIRTTPPRARTARHGACRLPTLSRSAPAGRSFRAPPPRPQAPLLLTPAASERTVLASSPPAPHQAFPKPPVSGGTMALAPRRSYSGVIMP